MQVDPENTTQMSYRADIGKLKSTSGAFYSSVVKAVSSPKMQSVRELIDNLHGKIGSISTEFIEIRGCSKKNEKEVRALIKDRIKESLHAGILNAFIESLMAEKESFSAGRAGKNCAKELQVGKRAKKNMHRMAKIFQDEAVLVLEEFMEMERMAQPVSRKTSEPEKPASSEAPLEKPRAYAKETMYYYSLDKKFFLLRKAIVGSSMVLVIVMLYMLFGCMCL
ncbi:uncharacterized protein NEMAJ01_0909 [Nematocida major]|uniref:uncharacterized protein n=1 Tax=Nematocida major TaxID=1912982 RepID=UPI00200761CB|nr:uncharacterized protein NEMAJ01_0909 [Nematocida major]KAH9386013.1 hypothetical protein NEMAJ01_0909 [Nematocida major]